MLKSLSQQRVAKVLQQGLAGKLRLERIDITDAQLLAFSNRGQGTKLHAAKIAVWRSWLVLTHIGHARMIEVATPREYPIGQRNTFSAPLGKPVV